MSTLRNHGYRGAGSQYNNAHGYNNNHYNANILRFNLIRAAKISGTVAFNHEIMLADRYNVNYADTGITFAPVSPFTMAAIKYVDLDTTKESGHTVLQDFYEGNKNKTVFEYLRLVCSVRMPHAYDEELPFTEKS